MASKLGTTTPEEIANSLAAMSTPFKSDSKALGGSKKIVKDVVKKEISRPLDDLSNFFAGIDKSLINLVVFAKKSFGLQEKEQKREDKDFVGPMPSTKMIRTGKETLVDTDKDSKEESKNVLGGMLTSLKDAFQEVDFGEKMKALLFIGGLALFLTYKEAIIKALTPLVKLVMGIVDILGVKGTLALLFGTIITIKLLPVIKAAKDIALYLGGFLPSFKTLKRAFRLMRVFIRRTLPRQLASAYKSGAFTKALKLLSFAFKALRLMMTATLYPAIISMVSTLAAAMGPILGPIIIIAAIAAGIAAVLFSIKSGFDTFKQSLEDGDGMLVAIGKGIADFAITLATLPITLIKKLVGFIAGLFGFDDFKAKLDKFSFKDMIKNAFFGFIGSFVKVIKAIAKGAAAALAAIAPGGKTPQAEFSRVYNEVMQGGKGKLKVENADLEATDTDGQPELTEKEVEDKIKEDTKDLSLLDKKILADRNKDKMLLDFRTDEKVLRDYYFDIEQEKKRADFKIKAQENKDFLALSIPERKMFKLNEANQLAATKLNPEAAMNEILIKQGDRIDQSTNVKHETHVSGDLAADNNEASQRLINSFGGSHLPR